MLSILLTLDSTQVHVVHAGSESLAATERAQLGELHSAQCGRHGGHCAHVHTPQVTDCTAGMRGGMLVPKRVVNHRLCSPRAYCALTQSPSQPGHVVLGQC